MSTEEIEKLVSSRNQPAFFHHSLFVSPTYISNSQSIGNSNFELEADDIDDAMYYSDVKEVICTENLICNKRISNAGQEWSAGRLGNRPIGAREAAQKSETCLGPYPTRDCVQSPHMGHNTREEIQASSQSPRQEDQYNISQPKASSSGRPAAEDHASPVIVLHPHRPPYFTGAQDDDVHIWTSIVNRWLDTI